MTVTRQDVQMPGESNKTVLRRFFEEVVNGGNLDVVDETIAPGLAEQSKQMATVWREAFPDLQVTVDRLIGEGEYVAASVTITGTHLGTLRFPGLPELAPTGMAVSWTGIDLVRIAGGQIVERHASRDLMRLLEALGAIEFRGSRPPA